MDIQTKKLNDMLHLFVTELDKFPVQDLHEFKVMWEKELISRGFKKSHIDKCIELIDMVIKYKTIGDKKTEKALKERQL